MSPRFFLALAAIAAGAGCASPEPECEPDTHETIEQICNGDFGFGDRDWNADEKAAMRRAAARWNAFIGVELVKVRAGKATCQIVNGAPPAGKSAWYAFETGTITIDRAGVRSEESTTIKPLQLSAVRGTTELEIVVMHEIGHSLGFNHRKAGGLMCSQAGDNFEAPDRAQCVELGWCTE